MEAQVLEHEPVQEEVLEELQALYRSWDLKMALCNPVVMMVLRFAMHQVVEL